MCDEHEDLSEERKKNFAKSFMQHICVTERFELMELVT